MDLREAKEVKNTKRCKVYTKIVKNCSVNELMLILLKFSSTIYMDYEALAHYRVKHSKNEFANNHINDI